MPEGERNTMSTRHIKLITLQHCLCTISSSRLKQQQQLRVLCSTRSWSSSHTEVRVASSCFIGQFHRGSLGTAARRRGGGKFNNFLAPQWKKHFGFELYYCALVQIGVTLQKTSPDKSLLQNWISSSDRCGIKG